VGRRRAATASDVDCGFAPRDANVSDGAQQVVWAVAEALVVAGCGMNGGCGGCSPPKFAMVFMPRRRPSTELDAHPSNDACVAVTTAGRSR
jgi:hypothetical protein